MLTDIRALVQATDGRYASDDELLFLQRYGETAKLRIQTYQKIQTKEQQIVAEVLQRLNAEHPELLRWGGQDLTPKWQRDTVRVLRYGAAALLLDDIETLKEDMLVWFRSIMGAFYTQDSCNQTYTAMQGVIIQHLTPEELRLFWPILELCRVTLGQKA